eukprot:TRINITY_DN14602_c0_g1_i2.p1 TRINITY_DN14602_c0_g1~~TRINITY_DN14602_c0_g1_i2.p1  ORF type:complete len:355 (+),score=77.10 TRINITY_DN14602_c0_g1_i2:143-1207(+)
MESKRYTYEFMVSLKEAKTDMADGFCAPAEVRAETVRKLGVVKKRDKVEVVGGDDVLGPEERAKLEEIQRLVRQQQPRPVWVPRGGSQERSSLEPQTPEPQQPQQHLALTPSVTPLNPNAKPFVPAVAAPPAETLPEDSPQSNGVSPSKRSRVKMEDPPVPEEDEDGVWSSDITLPPMPPTAKKVEQNEWRLRQRQKQIRIGLQTIGYKNYIRAKELKFEVEAEQPRIPNVYQVCSKRAWDGQVRRWRQLLHKYDDLTDVLWNEEEAKEIHKISERQQTFKEKVRRQQLQAELNVIKEISTPSTEPLPPPGQGSFEAWPTAPTEPVTWCAAKVRENEVSSEEGAIATDATEDGA